MLDSTSRTKRFKSSASLSKGRISNRSGLCGRFFFFSRAVSFFLSLWILSASASSAASLPDWLKSSEESNIDGSPPGGAPPPGAALFFCCFRERERVLRLSCRSGPSFRGGPPPGATPGGPLGPLPPGYSLERGSEIISHHSLQAGAVEVSLRHRLPH